MKSDDEWGPLKEWFEGNFLPLAAIVGFVVDMIALSALIASSTPAVPPIRRGVAITFELTIWSIALLTYVGLLHERWRSLILKREQNFADHLLHLLFRFEQPKLLIPLVTLAGIFIAISFQLAPTGTFFLWLIGIALLSLPALIVWYRRRTAAQQAREKKEAEEIANTFSAVWESRITKHLEWKSYVTQLQLSNRYQRSASLCLKALATYFKEYESERDLVLVSEEVHDSKTNRKIKVTALAERTLLNADRVPWKTEFR